MKTYIIILGVVLLIGTTFAYEFELGVTFYDTPTDVAYCTLGVCPGATDGIDSHIDVPAPPPFMMFTAQIQNASPYTNLQKDIRSDTDTLHIWTVLFYNFTVPGIVVRWDSTLVPSDEIRNMSIGAGTDVDSITWTEMAATDSFFISYGYFTYIKLTQNVEPTPPDTVAPIISDWVPENGDTVPGDTVVAFTATDDAAIDTSFDAIHLWINGTDYYFSSIRTPLTGGFRVEYSPSTPFEAGSLIMAIAEVRDLGSPPNVTTDTIEFRIAEETPEPVYTLTVNVELEAESPPPLSGTNVEILELALSDTTDTNGTVVFDSLSSDTYTIVANRDSFFPEDTIISLYSDTTVTLILIENLTGGIAVSGIVTLAGSSELEGSVMELTAVSDDSLVAVDTTDEYGIYIISGIMPGQYKLKASHENFWPDSVTFTASTNDTIVNFHLEHTGIGEGRVPEDYTLLMVEPNPFNSSCRITASGPVEIYDVLGRFVRRIDIYKASIKQFATDQPQSAIWDGRDLSGNELPSGVYFAIVRSTNGKIITGRRILLVR